MVNNACIHLNSETDVLGDEDGEKENERGIEIEVVHDDAKCNGTAQVKKQTCEKKV